MCFFCFLLFDGTTAAKVKIWKTTSGFLRLLLSFSYPIYVLKRLLKTTFISQQQECKLGHLLPLMGSYVVDFFLPRKTTIRITRTATSARAPRTMRRIPHHARPDFSLELDTPELFPPELVELELLPSFSEKSEHVTMREPENVSSTASQTRRL